MIPLLMILLLLLTSPLLAENQLVVIQYHHVSAETPRSTSVSPQEFRNHLDYLEKAKFNVVSLEETLIALQAGEQIPQKAIAITFDDAYVSVFENGFPELKKRNWPFTIFIATESIDQKQKAFLSWSQMREMAKFKASYGLHSHTHPYYVRKRQNLSYSDWKTWALKDIELSRRRIKEELSSNTRLFAYTYGEYNLELKSLIKELNLIGVAQHSGVVWEKSDFLSLPRFPVSGVYAEMSDFMVKVNTLSLPVIAKKPEEPVVYGDKNLPILELKLLPGNYQLDQLSCYATGQGRMEVRWIDRSNLVLQVVPKKPLPLGRSKYNCTAPDKNSNRYYWFSRQWLRVE